ncbi:hypothetical protein CLV35_2913 [Motilibacter peucedani]|uniref:Uncharacterized protein n=1 Tax=Motilibacter peucedani TaxID=598650 RepID=A0A420XN17_9ACTN|nr:hypothetical protein [Motilibacter peucedani]RKS72665.1 hypothetical protein CLV35_2913 [Motilibacter peucedani]
MSARAPLEAPVFPATPEAMARAVVPTAAGGLLLGTTRSESGSAPVAISAFSWTPTRLVVDDVELGRIIALRALALGARVAVGTTRPAAWQPLVRVAGEAAHRITVGEGISRGSGLASAQSPVLLVRDRISDPRRVPGARQAQNDLIAVEAAAAGPWRCLVTVTRSVSAVDPAASLALGRAHVALLANGSTPLLEAFCDGLGLDPAAARRMLPEPAAAVAGQDEGPAHTHLLLARRGPVTRVQVAPTEIERRMR